MANQSGAQAQHVRFDAHAAGKNELSPQRAASSIPIGDVSQPRARRGWGLGTARGEGLLASVTSNQAPLAGFLQQAAWWWLFVGRADRLPAVLPSNSCGGQFGCQSMIWKRQGRCVRGEAGQGHRGRGALGCRPAIRDRGTGRPESGAHVWQIGCTRACQIQPAALSDSRSTTWPPTVQEHRRQRLNQYHLSSKALGGTRAASRQPSRSAGSSRASTMEGWRWIAEQLL